VVAAFNCSAEVDRDSSRYKDLVHIFRDWTCLTKDELDITRLMPITRIQIRGFALGIVYHVGSTYKMLFHFP
jgi:hypothetical protein